MIHEFQPRRVNTDPVAYVTKNKQRIKQYSDTVYLNNGDEFEIELFNPTTNKVLARIELNGKSIGSGIVLRPGERVFLERYINEARKFLFETYTVNGKNSDVQRAIANNGVLNVKFYNETVWYNSVTTHYPVYTTPTITWPTNPYIYYTNTCCGGGTTMENNVGHTLTNSNSNCCDTSQSSTFFSASLGDAPMQSRSMSKSSLKQESIKEIETGRIEKGSYSDQAFKFDDTSFNSYYSWQSTWKILPISQKTITKDDLVTYCTNCGTKRKKDSFKFCPNCGTKF